MLQTKMRKLRKSSLFLILALGKWECQLEAGLLRAAALNLEVGAAPQLPTEKRAAGQRIETWVDVGEISGIVKGCCP
jgi:hypothetical protein